MLLCKLEIKRIKGPFPNFLRLEKEMPAIRITRLYIKNNTQATLLLQAPSVIILNEIIRRIGSKRFRKTEVVLTGFVNPNDTPPVPAKRSI